MKSLTVTVVTAVIVLFTAVAGDYLGQIGCSDYATNTNCTADSTCTFTCPSGCGSEGLTPNIWGTGIYIWDSPICRAAIHDYRMPLTASGMNVTISRNSTDAQKYLPTINQGITSIEWGKITTPNGFYQFTSPYIKEDVLDVATMTYNSTYTEDGFNQACIQSVTETPTYFQYYIPLSKKNSNTGSVSGTANPSGIQWFLTNTSWQGLMLYPGGYWCNLVNNTYSNVMSLAMASDAYFKPDQWTLTRSIHQSVVIHFSPTKPATGSIAVVWRKDTKSLYSFPNMVRSNNETGYYLQIDDLQVGDGGIYSLEIKKQTGKKAVMRLIVRRCEENMFGPNCDQQCPTCQNGGVCHDVMGTCICAPGYNGPNCENSCPANYFGQKCAFGCNAYSNDQSNPCNGALICLPDPFGCQCAPGYSGLNCDQHESKDMCESDSDCASDQSCQATDQGIKDCAGVCPSISCGPNTNCMGVSHSATCQCQPGFTGNANDVNTGCQAESQDACQSDSDCATDQSCQVTSQGMKVCAAVCMASSCGPNANCMGANHMTSCQCLDGFTGDASDVSTGCQAESQNGCQSDSDCAMDQSCQDTDMGIKNCAAVCMATSCGPNANCMGVNHMTSCQCLAGFTGNANDVNTGCQATSGGGGSADCGSTLDPALQNAVQSNPFQPYVIPVINLVPNMAILSQVRVFNLKNLRRTGTCTMTMQQGGYSTDQTTIGASNILVIAYLSDYGLFGNISPSNKFLFSMNIQSFNSMLNIKIPTDPSTAPTLEGYQTLQLIGVRVTVAGGSAIVNQLANLLIALIQNMVPSLFNGIINFILTSMFAELVNNLSL